jgi:hypothetical protein
MSGPSLKALLSPRSGNLPALAAFLEATGASTYVTDQSGKVLLGEMSAEFSTASIQLPVLFESVTLGFVNGPPAPVNALTLMLTRLAARESEGRALASEVLHLYREVHLIEQLSEQLSALLNFSAVSQSALEQAQRMIPATQGCILVMESTGGPLRNAASFGDGSPLAPDSLFAASILERGIAEIINNCASDPRALDAERSGQHAPRRILFRGQSQAAQHYRLADGGGDCQRVAVR